VLVRKPLDGRTALARAVERFKADIIADLGGDPSRAQLAIIEACSRTWVLLESVDNWLQQQPSLIDKRKRAMLPVLRERQQLADSLLRHLTSLGLERHSRHAEKARAFLTGPAQP
jgi:hypothetical protein